MKKILLFGSQGMLGSEFLYAAEKEFEVIPLARFHVDLQTPESIVPEIERWQPDAVVNCAGWTAVEEAENPKFEQQVTTLNELAPEQMAIGCKLLYIPFFHFSTDYVFSGKKSTDIFTESDTPNPCNFYGLSKYRGEVVTQEAWEKTYILRTAWLYGKYGPNFVKKIQKLAKSKQPLTIVDDQYGNPTWTLSVCRVLIQMLRDIFESGVTSPEPGIYHLVSEADEAASSWYDFAREIIENEKSKNRETKITPVSSAQFHTKAKRPTSSVLRNTKISPLPDWKEMLSEFLES